MIDDIDNIIRNSNKAELIEKLSEELEKTNLKVIVVLVQDKENGRYSSVEMTLGLNTTYEAFGILEIAKRDLIEDDK